MVKDIIYYNGKIYQVSTCKVYDNTCFETMIFPIDNENNVTGHEVYCFHTFEPGESENKHRDIILHPEKYVSDEVIVNYWKSKEYNSDDTSDDIYIVMGTILEHGEPLDSWVEEVFDNEEQANACYQYLNHMKTQSNVNYWVTNKVYQFCKVDYVQQLKELDK